MTKKLPLTYYLNEDVLHLSQDLIGKVLFSSIDQEGLAAGIIVETECYRGPEDKGSHAYLGKKTPRNEVMFYEGGVAYVYLCYGIHPLFNVVTNIKDIPHAILIRAIEPICGIDLMQKRRNFSSMSYSLTAGPGCLTRALGITKKHNGISLTGQEIWIEDHGYHFSKEEIINTSRVGIEYAEEHALLPWRFYIKNNPWVSKR